MNQITKRLRDGSDLKKEIINLIEEEGIKAGIIGSIVGSLKVANLRMAGAKISRNWTGPLEIVSGTGTLSKDGIHVHISISDEDGNVSGGHLQEGCLVRTTVELVALIFDDIEYKREIDKNTGYPELSTK